MYLIPAIEILHIDGDAQQCDYTLVNAFGAAVLRGVLHGGNNVIDVARLSAGVYVLEMSSEGGSKPVWKVVKE